MFGRRLGPLDTAHPGGRACRCDGTCSKLHRTRGETVPVTGIELSSPITEQRRTKVDEQAIPVIVGDMATARAPEQYSLVFLVINTIANLLTQAEQVACFRNAATHLSALRRGIRP